MNDVSVEYYPVCSFYSDWIRGGRPGTKAKCDWQGWWDESQKEEGKCPRCGGRAVIMEYPV